MNNDNVAGSSRPLLADAQQIKYVSTTIVTSRKGVPASSYPIPYLVSKILTDKVSKKS
jgi:hypothetical protein